MVLTRWADRRGLRCLVLLAVVAAGLALAVAGTGSAHAEAPHTGLPFTGPPTGSTWPRYAPDHSWTRAGGNKVECVGDYDRVEDLSPLPYLTYEYFYAGTITWKCWETGTGPLPPTIWFGTAWDAPGSRLESYYEVLRAMRMSSPTTGELLDCGDESGVHPSIWEPEPTLTEQYSSSGSLSWGDSYYSNLAGYSYDPYAR